MATFFGEVVPVFSRAVDEDDDVQDDNEYQNIPSAAVIRWIPKIREQLDDNKLIKCDVLVIAVGDAGTSFVQTYVLQRESEVIGTICSGMKDNDENTLSQKSPTDKASFIYKLTKTPRVLVCQCTTDVAAEQAFSWVDGFLSKVNLDDAYIAVLNSTTTSNYQSVTPHGDLKTPFLRSLKTVWFKGTPCCPYLESPNCVTGLPAQILTYCQMKKVPTVLYTVYADSIYLDSATVKEFMKIAAWTPLKDVCVKDPKSDELLNKLVEQHQKKNSLYM